jgi:hypothetical protein
MAAKIEPTERQSADAAAGSDDLNQQLRAVVEQRIGLQPNHLDEDEPVERDNLRPGGTSYLNHEASQRKAIYDRLVTIENEVKKARLATLAKAPPLPCRRLNWCRSYLGLAILWRISKANNRDESSGTWLVATGQANDRDFDSVDWLDEITEWS